MLSKLNDDDLTPKSDIHIPVAEVRDALPEEQTNTWIDLQVDDSFTDAEIELLVPKYALRDVRWHESGAKELAYNKIRAVFLKLHFHPLVSYTIIKSRKAHTYSRTPEYPIFLIDEGKHKAIYQPLHPDPEHRLVYDGNAPRNFIHGLAQLETAKRKADDAYTIALDDAKNSNGEDSKPIEKPKKNPEILLVRDVADVFGPAVLGYGVCWYNKPYAIIDDYDFNLMARLAEKVYQVINNLESERKIAHLTALKHLDLFNLELPEYYQPYPDQPIMPIADLFDFINLRKPWDLKELLKQALPYRFWEQEREYEGRGDARTFVGWKYAFDNVQAYNFLNKMGFHRMAVEDRKTDYIYIQVQENIVAERIPVEVKNFINRFVKERQLDKELRNTLYKSQQLSEGSLSNLDEIEIDFKAFDDKRQFLFFENGSWEVTGAGIIAHKPGEVNRYVWEKDVIPHSVQLADAPFTITRNKDGQAFGITVHHQKCLFFNYLINTSRIHWRKEMEEEAGKLEPEAQKAYLEANKFNIAGELLSIEERAEQEQHLINKIFALGYLMHRYKDRDRSWAVVAMDNTHNSDGKSYGGTGKSICFGQALPQVLRNMHQIPGTNKDKTKDPHIFHGLTKYHQATLIDDADKLLDFRFFFEFITGNQVVNPKQSQPFTIAFDDLGKLIWLTNFAFISDSSTKRRILYTVFSDWYHEKTDDDDFKESRSPKDDMGKALFSQFEKEEWDAFFTTMASCISFALRCPVKLNPPMNNVARRNMQREMGPNFEEWANVFFSPLSGNLDRFLVKGEAYQEFLRDQNLQKSSYSTHKFKTSIKQYCIFSDFIFCPEELINDRGPKGKDRRIIHNVMERRMNKDGDWQDGSKKTSQELIYIQTDTDKELNRKLPGEDNAITTF
jgi:hypothetical protein